MQCHLGEKYMSFYYSSVFYEPIRFLKQAKLFVRKHLSLKLPFLIAGSDKEFQFSHRKSKNLLGNRLFGTESDKKRTISFCVCALIFLLFRTNFLKVTFYPLFLCYILLHIPSEKSWKNTRHSPTNIKQWPWLTSQSPSVTVQHLNVITLI